MKKVLVTNRNGYTLNFYAAANYMDEDIIPYLSDMMAPCTEQEFFTAYEWLDKKNEFMKSVTIKEEQ